MENLFQLKPKQDSFHYDYYYPEATGDIEYYLRLIQGWTPVISTETETFFTRKDYMGQALNEIEGKKIETFDVIFLGVLHFPFARYKYAVYPDVVSSEFILTFDFKNTRIYETGRVCYNRWNEILYSHDGQVLMSYEEDSVLQTLYKYALVQYKKLTQNIQSQIKNSSLNIQR